MVPTSTVTLQAILCLCGRRWAQLFQQQSLSCSLLPRPLRTDAALRQKSKCHCLGQSPIYFQVRLGACGTFMSSLALACGWPPPARHRSPPCSAEQCRLLASLIEGPFSARNASHTRFCRIMPDSFVETCLCFAVPSTEQPRAPCA